MTSRAPLALSNWILGLAALVICAFAALGPAFARSGDRPGTGQKIAASDALVLGTTNQGRVNFVMIGRNPDKPHFSGFHLRGDGKAGGVPAGRYMIGGWFFNSTISSYSLIGALYGGQDRVGEIAVGPGEAIYIGHLVFDRDGETVRFRVEDRFEQLRAKLPAPLAARVQKRLITLPASLDFGKPIRTRL